MVAGRGPTYGETVGLRPGASMTVRRPPLRHLLLLGALALVLGAPEVAAPAPAQKAPKAVPGELLLGFEAGVSDAERRAILRAFGAVEKRRFGRIRGSLVSLEPSKRGAALEALGRDPRVRYAELNYVLEATAPNDPFYDRLWGIVNFGQFVNGSFGTPDADADVDGAWAVTTGDRDVVVAVIDTGVDQAHPDLAANTWVNAGEDCAGCRTDGRDNDGNGYVDDWRGWDFVGGDNNPADDHGHGTHVAGTIGAVGDNATGVVGVNWSVGLMALKFLGSDGSGSTADAVAAILYAAANGADVLNNSWAGGEYSQSLRDAIAAADDRDALFVAAAGNDGMDNDAVPTYPASYDVPNVLAVAASDNADRHAFFSNFGMESVDVSAPGVGIFSTWPGGSYQYSSGTSMAAPQVSGVAALVEAATTAASDVGTKTLLLRTADPLSALSTLTATGARLNAQAALTCSSRPLLWLDSPSDGFQLEEGESLTIALSASACADPAGVAVSASVDGAPVTLVARGDGHYSASYTPAGSGPVQLSVTASTGGSVETRTISGAVQRVYPIAPGGSPVTVTTTVPGEDARLVFEGRAGDRVSLLVRNVTLSPTFLSMTAPDGSAFGPTAFVGKTGIFLDVRTLPATGTYRIALDAGAAASGSLTLELYDVPPDASGPIVRGGPALTLATTVPGQNARATFDAPAGARVSLRLAGVTVKSATVALVRGTSTVASTVVGTAGGFLDVQALAAGGEYALVVNPQTSYTGSLALTLYDVPPDAGGPIASDGSARVVATTTPGQNARLSFDGRAGERYSVKVGSGLSSAYVSVVGPGGTVGSRTLVGASGGLLDVRTLDTTGPHEVLVDPQGAATGSTSVSLYAVPPDLEAAIAPGGAPVTVTTTAPGQNARAAFAGSAGRRIALQLSSPTMASAYVSILAPDGSAVLRNVLVGAGGAFVDAELLAATGAHTVFVDPIGAAVGSLTLQLYDVPDDASGTLAAGAPPFSLALSAGQNARLSFEGVAGRRMSLVLSAVTLSSSIVTILRPNGSTHAAAIVSTTGRTFTLDLNATGAYVVLVDPRAAASGAMSLRLTAL